MVKSVDDAPVDVVVILVLLAQDKVEVPTN